MLDAISFLDADLIAEHLDKKQSLTAAKKKKTMILKCSSLAAAVAMICLGAIAIQMIPVRLDLDYSYVDNSTFYPVVQGITLENYQKYSTSYFPIDDHVYCISHCYANGTHWIYYKQKNRIKKKLVYLPCSSYNFFLAWKKLNGIGDEVQLLDYECTGNEVYGQEEFMGRPTLVVLKQADTIYYNITLSENIKNYASGEQYDQLIESLKKTLAPQSKDSMENIKAVIFNISYK